MGIFFTWQVILIASYQGESDGPRPITSSSSLGLTCAEITRDINGHNKTMSTNANEGQSQRLPDTSLPFILQTVAMQNQKATPRNLSHLNRFAVLLCRVLPRVFLHLAHHNLGVGQHNLFIFLLLLLLLPCLLLLDM